MSSHHFVKEDQEPALLIIDPEALAFEKIQELLEWSPTVLVLDDVLENVLRWGIKVDGVLTGPNPTDDLQEMIEEQSPLKLISYSSSLNAWEAAFQFLVDSKLKYVNVLSGKSAEIFSLSARFANHLNIVVFIDGVRWGLVKGGKFEKWLTAGTRLQVLDSSNFLQHLENKSDGIMKIERPGIFFWVGEMMDA